MTITTWPLPSRPMSCRRSCVNRAIIQSELTRSGPRSNCTFSFHSSVFSWRRKMLSVPRMRHRQLARLQHGHRRVHVLVQPQRLALHVEVERAGLPLPAVDAELHGDVVRQPRAVIADLGGDDLHAVAGAHAHAALRVGFLRLRVELRLRAGELVREPVRAEEGELHALEGRPARLERHDARGADAGDDASADRLHVLEGRRFRSRLVAGPHRGGHRLGRFAAPGRGRLVPAEDDEDDEREEDDRQRDAESSNRALHVVAP